MDLLPKAAYDSVSAVLGRELDLLDGLTFGLEMQRVVLCAGNDRWLPRACREVERSLDELRQADLVRAIHVSNLALDIGLGSGPSLRDITDAVGEPWKGIFAGQHHAFVVTVGEVRRLAWHNRTRLTERGRSAGRALRLVSPLEPAGGNGEDELLLDVVCAIATSSLQRVISPCLADFLAG
jgi:hypothetical protein